MSQIQFPIYSGGSLTVTDKDGLQGKAQLMEKVDHFYTVLFSWAGVAKVSETTGDIKHYRKVRQ